MTPVSVAMVPPSVLVPDDQPELPADVANPPDVADIIGFAKARLASYKAPKTVEFIESLPRSEAMKLSRGALVLERDGPEPADESPGAATA